MKSKISLIIFLLFSGLLISKTPNQDSQDSIIRHLAKLPNSKQKIKDIHKLLGELDDVQFCYQLAELAYNISLEIKDPLSTANSLNNLGTYSKVMSNYQQALHFYNKELVIREQLGDRSSYAETLRLIGELNRAYQNFDKALIYTNRAKKIFIEIKDAFGVARTDNRLAAIYFEINGPKYFDSIIYYGNKSLKYSLKNEEFILAISNYNILASLYREQNKYDKAIVAYNKAIELATKHGAEYFNLNLLNNLALTHYRTKNYRKAIEIGLQSFKQSELIKIDIYKQVAASILKDSYICIGDSSSAYKFSEIYSALYQENFNQQKAKLLADAEEKYESVKKEKDIEKQKQTQTNLIIIFTLLLLITLFAASFFYIRVAVLRKKNNLITEQTEKLIELNATKDKFFAIIAHDLKNPIGAFQGITEILNDDFDSFTEEEKKEFILLLKNSSSNLNDLLENLLVWSMSQRNKIVFNPDYHNIAQLIKHNFELLEIAASKKNIKLVNKIDTSAVAYCDANLINTVIRNITTNAVKFTKLGGQITISSKVVNDSKSNSKKIQISIADDGVGMPQNKVNSLFKIGENNSSDGTSGEKGTGLGLIICKEFIEKHNGEIWVESIQNNGTTFHFNLPIKP